MPTLPVIYEGCCKRGSIDGVVLYWTARRSKKWGKRRYCDVVALNSYTVHKSGKATSEETVPGLPNKIGGRSYW